MEFSWVKTPAAEGGPRPLGLELEPVLQQPWPRSHPNKEKNKVAY